MKKVVESEIESLVKKYEAGKGNTIPSDETAQNECTVQGVE